MNELALFAGAGGGILGGHLLGWRCVCAVEIDEYARRVLIGRQNDGCLRPFPIWDDITTFDGRPWSGRVDVVTGGFPCQDISCAGGGGELKQADLDCGNRWRGSSVKFDLNTSSWRTVLSLFPEDLQWSSVILPRWGMMRSGELWERITPVLHTNEIVSGSWPTPVASEGRDNNVSWAALARADKGGRIARRMASLGLPETQQTAKAALNPNWVEWLMGWPIGWTDCDASATDRFRQWCASHGKPSTKSSHE